MEFMELIEFMGEGPEHPALLAHFKQANITKQPRPDAGVYMAYVQFADQGYEMRFDLKPDGMQLFLSHIAAFPHGDPTHKPYVGKLPGDIQKNDTQESLAVKLGAPVMHNDVTNVDMWKLGNWNLVVRFNQETGAIKAVLVTVPKK